MMNRKGSACEEWWVTMQIDWDKTIEEILAEKAACPRCGGFTEELLAGYTREPWGADYAPRCQFCTRKDDCDARKLVVLCGKCAGELQLRARAVDQQALMTMLINDCRKVMTSPRSPGTSRSN